MTDLSGCTNYTDEALIQLLESECGTLNTLNLSGCKQIQLGFIGLRRSSSSRNCFNLELRQLPQISDYFMSWISEGCRNLQKIDLSDSHVTDKSLSFLSEGCRTMKVLIINRCRQISNQGIQIFMKTSGKYLREIHLRECFLVSDSGIKTISEYCKRLRYLDIHGLPHVTNKGLLLIAKSCRLLKVIDISTSIGIVKNSWKSNVPRIKDLGLVPFGFYCHSLQKLNCNGVSKIRNISKVVAGCPHLTKLSLRYCYDIIDVDVCSIAKYCKNMKSIDFGFCKHLTDSSLIKMFSQCRMIEKVYLRGCCRLTDSSVLVLARLCSYVVSLDLHSVVDITDKSVACIRHNLHFLRFADFTLTQVSLKETSRLEFQMQYMRKLPAKQKFLPFDKTEETYLFHRKVRSLP